MLDSYTKNMLFKYIINEYSDKEQLDIIKHLVGSLKDLNNTNLDKNSIEKVYYEGLNVILEDIEKLQAKEHDFLLDN